MRIALLKIRDERLYRPHQTFEEYCQKRWEFTRRYADNLIGSAKTVNLLIENKCSQIPTSEGQTRPLTSLDPEQQLIAWQKVVETAPEGI